MAYQDAPRSRWCSRRSPRRLSRGLVRGQRDGDLGWTRVCRIPGGRFGSQEVGRPLHLRTRVGRSAGKRIGCWVVGCSGNRGGKARDAVTARTTDLKMTSLKEHIYGCLVGVAAGDAMGMPTSLMSPGSIKETFGEYIKDFLPAPRGHVIHDKMVAGQVTDDTQQTLLIADSIIDTGGVDSRDIARRLLKWAEDIGAFDSLLVGPSSLRALHFIRALF